MSAPDTTTHIEAQGVQPDNFTMIPNMAFIDLSPTAFKLLAIYLDTARTNQVYAKNSTLSKQLGVTTNTMKKARKELADKGYVIFAPGKEGADTTTARVVIQINWMWAENHRRAESEKQARKDSEPTVSNSDTPLSNSDTVVSNSDTNNQYLKNKELNNQSIKLIAKSDGLDTDFANVRKRLVDELGLLTTAKDRRSFDGDFDEHGLDAWLKGIETYKAEITKQGALPYNYLASCVATEAGKAKQEALTKKPKVTYSIVGEVKRPSVTDGMINFDESLKQEGA